MAGGMARSGSTRAADRRALGVHRFAAPALRVRPAYDRPGDARRTPANQQIAGQVDVVVCTTGEDHLARPPDVAQPDRILTTRPAWPPALLGFECHAVLRDRLGDYDYYAYLEDDLISRDPWLFVKLGWFTAAARRRRAAPAEPLRGRPARARAQGLHRRRPSRRRDGPVPGRRGRPGRDRQPAGHDRHLPEGEEPARGLLLLERRQMESWARQPYFLDRDTRFIGPLESAATLGVMRTFRVYKAAAESAGFLEIEHFGTSFLGELRRRGDVDSAHS